MKTRNEILECKEGDRFIFIQYDENENVKWLNFHQGLSAFDDSFNKPCELLTKIYTALTLGEDSEDQHLFRVDLTKAIEVYVSINVDTCLPKNKNERVKQVIPQSQVAHIQRALNLLEHTLNSLTPNEIGDGEHVAYTLFDITTLRGMLELEVSISISREEMENFGSRHGVDFPEYN